jgi:hypothetical protein
MLATWRRRGRRGEGMEVPQMVRMALSELIQAAVADGGACC